VLRVRRRLYLFSVLWVLAASSALAQTSGPDPSKARVRLGPLWINPTLALTDLGVDTNVFNAADTDRPLSDFTMTVSPATELWVRIGRSWLTGNLREDLVWYREYAGERSANGRYNAGIVVPLTRVVLNANAGWIDTHERPGFEIDARAHRRERAYSGGLELRALSKTLIGVRGDRRTYDFESGEFFLGSNLREELNRTITTAAATIRYELTPLTSVGLDVAREQDRFELSPDRDADSTRVGLIVRLDPAALISGTAQVGFRAFNPASPDTPEYRGATAAVDVGYVLRGTTKLGMQISRDVNYSFESAQPYFLQTGIVGSLVQQISGPVDVQARLGRQRLAYRSRADMDGLDDRIDRVNSVGAGIGYHTGPDLRIGLNVDRSKRDSPLLRRHYEGMRYGLSVTYGQ
jgi:hypothetical protein